jgi:ribosomal protein S18 acetylase RimI-like enzyme
MTVEYRRFGRDENEVVAKIFVHGYNDLLKRGGSEPFLDVDDQGAWANDWERGRKALFAHFATSGSESWLAEDNGEVIGYARSILRDGIRQLTDFWVLPGRKTKGIGRELLDRTFRSDSRDSGRLVVATSDGAAVARYVKSGLEVLSPLLEFSRASRSDIVLTDISAEPMIDDEPTLQVLRRIDRVVLGFDRTIDHKWFLNNRTGFLYSRGGEAFGYGYVARWPGPFATLDPADLPMVLAHAESQAAKCGEEMLLIVPAVNAVAMRYLLSQGFHMNDKFVLLFMADTPRPRLDRYIMWWPGFC